MAVLPFIILPKSPEVVMLGNEEIGTLNIPKLGHLSINEQRWIKEELKDVPNINQEAVRLAKKVAESTGYALVDVYTAFTGGDRTLLQNNLEEVLAFQDALNTSSEQRSLVYATAILKFRVLPEWTIADTSDSKKIPLALVEEIAAFAFNEEARWVEPDPEAEVEPLTEEDLGKSSTETTPNPTGQNSTGDSSAISPMTIASAPSDLAFSPSA
jgi:hypothetical protein